MLAGRTNTSGGPHATRVFETSDVNNTVLERSQVSPCTQTFRLNFAEVEDKKTLLALALVTYPDA